MHPHLNMTTAWRLGTSTHWYLNTLVLMHLYLHASGLYVSVLWCVWPWGGLVDRAIWMHPYLMWLHLGTPMPTCWYLDSTVLQRINIDILVPQRSRTSMRLPHHQYQYILISRGHTSIRPYPCVCTFTHQYLNLSVPKHPCLDTAAPQRNSTNAPAHQCSDILYGDTDREGKWSGDTVFVAICLLLC